MEGGPGTDTYHVDDPGDVVVELQNSGYPDTVVSTVSFALPDFFDNLESGGIGAIDATGNDAANRITANLGNNVLAGRGGADEFRFFSATGLGPDPGLRTGRGPDHHHRPGHWRHERPGDRRGGREHDPVPGASTGSSAG